LLAERRLEEVDSRGEAVALEVEPSPEHRRRLRLDADDPTVLADGSRANGHVQSEIDAREDGSVARPQVFLQQLERGGFIPVAAKKDVLDRVSRMEIENQTLRESFFEADRGDRGLPEPGDEPEFGRMIGRAQIAKQESRQHRGASYRQWSH